MEKLNFYKYHGAGNDFIIIDARKNAPELTQDLVSFLCDRRFGIGADGFMALLIDPSGEEFYMRYFNSDGRESTMCGNGGRAIALFAHHLGIGGNIKRFNSIDGLHTVEVIEDNGDRALLKLQMIDVEKVDVHDNFLFLNTGSPHYIEFVEDVDKIDVAQRGAQLAHCDMFSHIGGTNVNFVQIISNGTLKMRTFERGVEAETFACGTGATAAAIAVNKVLQKDTNSFDITTRGGKLKIDFNITTDNKYVDVILQGEAQKVFTGEIII